MHVKLIKNGSKYYSSFLGGRQHIYVFSKDEPLKKCQRFLESYRKYHAVYPSAEANNLKNPTRPDECDFTVVATVRVEELERQCLMFNAGLMMIEKFDYSFVHEQFNVSVSSVDILPDISHKERVKLLNYALVINE
jgi:hypothetical protein